MINIEIKSDQIVTRNGISKRTGQPYLMREQEAWGFICGGDGRVPPYPTRISLQLEDNQPPFPAGNYILDPSSIYVGQYSKLSLGRIRLAPAQKTSVKGA